MYFLLPISKKFIRNKALLTSKSFFKILPNLPGYWSCTIDLQSFAISRLVVWLDSSCKARAAIIISEVFSIIESSLMDSRTTESL